MPHHDAVYGTAVLELVHREPPLSPLAPGGRLLGLPRGRSSFPSSPRSYATTRTTPQGGHPPGTDPLTDRSPRARLPNAHDQPQAQCGTSRLHAQFRHSRFVAADGGDNTGQPRLARTTGNLRCRLPPIPTLG